ncbi:MAG: hypothetical protein H6625_00425 [Bdellovibrionaceae bacterium]|nr:hypothetical protein [Pseudobdellovibrionaceae bacterium]
MDFDKSQIQSWIKNDRKASLAKYLMSGTHHGRPGCSSKIKGKVIELICAELDEESQFLWGKDLLHSKEYVAREIGCRLVSSGWKKHKKEVQNLMVLAAEDGDWEVREYAAGLFARVLALDFEKVSKIYLKWSKAGSPNLQRAIAVGVKYRAIDGNEDEAKTILDILKNMMPETDEYLRKNLGPFAIGDAVLPRFPKPTIKMLKKLAKDKDVGVRWNVAMSFSSAASRKFKKEGLPIVQSIAFEDSKLVARAVKKALRNLEV